MIVALAYNETPSYVAANIPGPYLNSQLGTEWLNWVAELGGLSSHDLVLLTSPSAELPQSVRAWRSVSHYTDRVNATGWPIGPNETWKQMLWILQDLPKVKKDERWRAPFLWIEPDCIPIREGWLATLEAEYQVALGAGKAFMGTCVPADPRHRCPEHMTGNAIYPFDAMVRAPNLGEPKWSIGHPAWDVHACGQLAQKYHKINHLLFHWWRHPPPSSTEELWKRVPATCVLYHSDKELKLIGALRAERRGEVSDAAKEIAKKFQEPPAGDLSALINAISKRAWSEGEVKVITQALQGTYGR